MDRLPSASTCYNTLKVPSVSTLLEIYRKRLPVSGKTLVIYLKLCSPNVHLYPLMCVVLFHFSHPALWIQLPTYKRASTLREKLLYAINSNAGFELS